MSAGGGRPTFADRQKIVLGVYAFAKGWLIAVVLWNVGALLVVLGLEMLNAKDAGSLYVEASIWPLFAMVSVAVAIVLGLPLGLALAYLLGPVRNQWIHVAVFFAAPALLFALPLGFVFGMGFWGGLMFGSLVGACSAIGRFAVIRNATIVDTTEPATEQP